MQTAHKKGDFEECLPKLRSLKVPVSPCRHVRCFSKTLASDSTRSSAHTEGPLFIFCLHRLWCHFAPAPPKEDKLYAAFDHIACCARLSICSAVESLEICPTLLSGQDKHRVTMCVQKNRQTKQNTCVASNDQISCFKPTKHPSEAHSHHVSIHMIEHGIHFGGCESQALTR